MAKHITLPLDQYQVASFLKFVRTKRDVISLWMNAIKAFLINNPPEESKTAAVISISVMSMSRLFCELDGGSKIFSISFPFTVLLQGDEIQFSSRGGVVVDNRISSQLLSLVEGGGIFEEPDFLRFTDSILDAVDTEPSLWELLRELMLAEDSYVRYDWDVVKINGHMHPEHHLDFSYSSNSTFKLGLTGRLDKKSLMGILDVETECHYLHAAAAK